MRDTHGRRCQRTFAATTCAVLLAAGQSPAVAAEALRDALLACADEPDDAARLRCFDATVTELRDGGPGQATAASTPSTTSQAPATAAATATTAAATAVSPTPTAEERFGARAEREKRGEISELTAKVTEVDAKPRGELVITLDNGQVWQEIAPGSKIKVKPGDEVKIEAGSFRSFILIAPNERSSRVSRVR